MMKVFALGKRLQLLFLFNIILCTNCLAQSGYSAEGDSTDIVRQRKQVRTISSQTDLSNETQLSSSNFSAIRKNDVKTQVRKGQSAKIASDVGYGKLYAAPLNKEEIARRRREQKSTKDKGNTPK